MNHEEWRAYSDLMEHVKINHSGLAVKLGQILQGWRDWDPNKEPQDVGKPPVKRGPGRPRKVREGTGSGTTGVSGETDLQGQTPEDASD